MEENNEYERVIGFLSQTTPELAAELNKIELTESETPSVPNYRIVKRIGTGGFGDVWLVQNTLDRQHYAMKTLKAGRESELSAIREFKRRIPDHSHLVPIGHVGETDGTIYYLMPLADNALFDRMRTIEDYEPMTLMEHVNRNGKLSAEQVTEIAVDLLSALETMHSAGGIHRDVKPANILMFDGNWCLSDPGLMSLCCDDSPKAGTSPYRKSDEQQNDIFADMYALAVTLEKIYDGRDVGANSERLRAAIVRAKSEGEDGFRSTKEMQSYLSRRLRDPYNRRSLRFASYVAVAALAFAASWLFSNPGSSFGMKTPGAVGTIGQVITYLPNDLTSPALHELSDMEWGPELDDIDGTPICDIGIAKPGGSITFVLEVPRDGNYNLHASYFLGTSRGAFRISLGDEEAPSTVDLFRPENGFANPFYHGTFALCKGSHRVKYELLENTTDQRFDIAIEKIQLVDLDFGMPDAY